MTGWRAARGRRLTVVRFRGACTGDYGEPPTADEAHLRRCNKGSNKGRHTDVGFAGPEVRTLESSTVQYCEPREHMHMTAIGEFH